MKRGYQWNLSQFCPAAPRGFCQFHGAGRGGGAACFSAGRGERASLNWSLNAVGAAAAQTVDKIQIILVSSVLVALGETQYNVPNKLVFSQKVE